MEIYEDDFFQKPTIYFFLNHCVYVFKGDCCEGISSDPVLQYQCSEFGPSWVPPYSL